MLMDDAEKARTEIRMLVLGWEQFAEKEVVGSLLKREEGRGSVKQWRGRRGRNIFRA